MMELIVEVEMLRNVEDLVFQDLVKLMELIV